MTTTKTVTTSARAAGKGISVKSSVRKTPARKAAPAAKAAARPLVKKAVAAGAAKSAVRRPKREFRAKVVRDSFTMPQNEYQKIAEIKETCLKAGLPVKKSEVLRAGLKALADLKTTQLRRALADVEKIKTGRPKKH